MHTSSSSDSLGSPRGLTFARSVKQARHRRAVFSSPSSASSRSSCSSDRTGSEHSGSPRCWAPLSAAVGSAQRASQAAHSSSPSPAPSLSSHGTSLLSPSSYAVTEPIVLQQPTSAHAEAEALQQHTPASTASAISALTPASQSSIKAGAGASPLLPGHATPEHRDQHRGQHSWHTDDKENDGSGTPVQSRSHPTPHDGFKIGTPASSSAALQWLSRRESSEWLTPKQQLRPQQQLLQTPPAASAAAVTPAVHSVAAPGTILDPYTPWLRTGTKHKQRRSIGSNDSGNESPMVLSSDSGGSFGVADADGSSSDDSGSGGSSASGRRRLQPGFSTLAVGPLTQRLTQDAVNTTFNINASGAYDDVYAFPASSSRASSGSGGSSVRHNNSDSSDDESAPAAAAGGPGTAKEGALGKVLQPAAALFEALPALKAMPPRPRGGRAPTQVHNSWQADTVRKFVRQRKQLAQGLYHAWNDKVFDGQLPAELPLVWNPRLLTTAGQVVDDKSQNHLKTERGQKRACRLDLSPKVIDTEDRLRDTLAHEMCHVGAWMISHDYIRPHGGAFQHWGRRFEARVPGIKITTCHSYQIHKAHRWQCQNERCARIYSRHAASIDPSKHVCGVCHAKLTYLGKFGRDGQPEAPKAPPSAFSLYVKQHFAETKRALPPGTPHRQVMTSLGSAWKAKKEAATPAAGVPKMGGRLAAAGTGVDVRGAGSGGAAVSGSAAVMAVAAAVAGAAAGQGTAAAPPLLPGSDTILDGDVSGADSPVEMHSPGGAGSSGRASSPSSSGNGSGGGVHGVVQGIADFLGRLALVQD